MFHKRCSFGVGRRVRSRKGHCHVFIRCVRDHAVAGGRSRALRSIPRSFTPPKGQSSSIAPKATARSSWSIHGGLGGCDQARIMAEWVDPTRYHILSPSRPGYLGTPLETGRTMEQQADALAALLDILGIQRATVVGLSTGGPAAYLFAVRHPKRVGGLIVIDGVSGHYDEPEADLLNQAIFLSDLAQKMLVKVGVWNPRVVLQGLFQSEALFTKKQTEKQIEHVMADERLLAFVKAFTDSMSPYRLRKGGTENDYRAVPPVYPSARRADSLPESDHSRHARRRREVLRRRLCLRTHSGRRTLLDRRGIPSRLLAQPQRRRSPAGSPAVHRPLQSAVGRMGTR